MLRENTQIGDLNVKVGSLNVAYGVEELFEVSGVNEIMTKLVQLSAEGNLIVRNKYFKKRETSIDEMIERHMVGTD